MQTLATTLCLTVTTIALQAQSSTRAPDFAETLRLIREGMAKDTATAAAIAVVRDGATIREEGFGWVDQENKLAATPNTPFLLASLTKTFEATLAAVLYYQQRRLDLDGPVNDYLRTTGVSSPATDVRDVTIRRLLTHTSGISTFDIGCDADLPRSRCHLPTQRLLTKCGSSAAGSLRNDTYRGWPNTQLPAKYRQFAHNEICSRRSWTCITYALVPGPR